MQQIQKDIAEFFIVGISVRTSNRDGSAMTDIPALWQKFFAEGVAQKIPNAISPDIYCLYTDYESDFMGEYTTIIGLKVDNLKGVAEDFVTKKVKGGSYSKFIAKGEMPTAVLETWQAIWQNDASLERKYGIDFEVYGAKSQDGENSEVAIYLS